MRTTVYIPDDLGERLERWKERVNVSSILQDALGRELARLESVPADFSDLEAILSRLKDEKDEWEKRWHEVGVAFGTEWARQAVYPSLRRWGEQWRKERTQKKRKLPVNDPLTMVLWGEFGSSRVPAEYVLHSDLLTKYPSLSAIYEYDDETGGVYKADYDPEALGRGWLDAVANFWEVVREKL